MHLTLFRVLGVHWETRLTWSRLTGRLHAIAGGSQTRKYTPDITAATEETEEEVSRDQVSLVSQCTPSTRNRVKCITHGHMVNPCRQTKVKQPWCPHTLKDDGSPFCCSPTCFSVCVHAKLLQLCPPLCDRIDCSLPGSSVQGILQARMLEWVAISYSRASSRPRDGTHVSYMHLLCLLHWQALADPFLINF